MLERIQRAAARTQGALAFVSLPILLAGCEPSPGEVYPGPWVEQRSPAIDRVLNDHNVPGCANRVYRPSNVSRGPLDPRGDFLVYCSADGASWTAYVASPGLARDSSLTGPFAAYAEVPPP